MVYVCSKGEAQRWLEKQRHLLKESRNIFFAEKESKLKS